LGALARRMFRELERRESIFDLAARAFVLGDAARDMSVRLHGRRAASPFGPAAGPHTQLAQNMVLSWLAGGRILELKTVQANDALTIPRPCIDMQTVGYNVEWSQELRLEQSLEEYVKGAMLIRMLVASGRLPIAPGFDRTVFDMSVGYDLAGIRSERVQAFIRGMRNATPVVERLRRELTGELAAYRDVEFPMQLSGTLTLSTFHGCPPGEIARIVEFLLRELRLDCVVKLNPTLLGREEVGGLLHDALGYTDVTVPASAFDRDTTWEQAVDFCGRLADTAASVGLGFGVKFCNTLVTLNHRAFFPDTEREMYLSGPPLHVLAMHLVRRFRRTFGDRIPISFSAGIDRHNFPDVVALGLVPVTVCTDLLKPGGYARGAGYCAELARRMAGAGAATVDEFIVRTDAVAEARGDDPLAAPDRLAAAKLRNTERYVEQVARDPRYHAERHRRVPRKIGRALALFDCLTCDKCIAVCPNDALFSVALEPPEGLALRERRQIAVFVDFCNECGNCDVFCPEDGGPHLRKPRVFVSRERWLADAPRDAMLVERDGITARIAGVVYRGDDGSSWAPILTRLRDAVVAPDEVNHVSACV
jgi:putative selenate reductase